MVSKEFFEALADLETEKGIKSEVFIEALRGALISAYKKQFEGGAGGGTVITAGTPEDVAKCKESFTGQFLKPILKRGF